LRYIVQRVILMIPVLIGISVLVFLLARFAPGDPVQVSLGLDYTPEQAAQMRHEMGLDQPLPVQYARWISNVVQGNLGRSIVMNQSVRDIILQRIPTTAAIAFAAVFIALLMSVPLGVIAAIRKDSWVDNLMRVVAIVGASMPVFWLGILLLMLFSVRLHWFPAGGGVGDHGIRALILPSLSLSFAFAALITRMVRSMMLEVLGDDYIRTARAKGLGAPAVYVRHALRNALIPVITVVGLQFGTILGGAVLTETIFNIPGLGRLLIEAASRRDYPLIQGTVLVTAFAFVCVNLLVDVLYVVANPQIRYS
ncbi:MAG TPA: nickel ABC transporter permease, partial [Nitrolancea sp.]|nr:nickel ABC transporter permease [Nitrolancea sp.]